MLSRPHLGIVVYVVARGAAKAWHPTTLRSFQANRGGFQRAGIELAKQLAGLRIVEAHQAVEPCRGDRLAVRAEGSRVNRSLLSLTCDPFAVAGVVDAHLAGPVVAAAGNETAAVLVESQSVKPAGHRFILA